jgi:hypothetical protein
MGASGLFVPLISLSIMNSCLSTRVEAGSSHSSSSAWSQSSAPQCGRGIDQCPLLPSLQGCGQPTHGESTSFVSMGTKYRGHMAARLTRGSGCPRNRIRTGWTRASRPSTQRWMQWTKSPEHALQCAPALLDSLRPTKDVFRTIREVPALPAGGV